MTPPTPPAPAPPTVVRIQAILQNRRISNLPVEEADELEPEPEADIEPVGVADIEPDIEPEPLGEAVARAAKGTSQSLSHREQI